MINPATLLVVGLVTGIGGAVTYSVFQYAEKGGNNPVPKTEAERKAQHERIYGKGSAPPLERLGRGQTANDLLPMSPESGPPLPRALGIRWPWKK